MNKVLCNVTPSKTADKQVSYKRKSSSLYIRDLLIEMSVGIYPQEHENKQPVLINIEAVTSLTDQSWSSENIKNVASYETVVQKIEAIAHAGHIELLETFADMVVQSLFKIPMISEVIISVEKPTIFEQAKGAGIKLHAIKKN